jgi:hypothetical protein
MVKLSLSLTKQHTMKMYWGSGQVNPPLGKRIVSIHWEGGYMGPRDGLDVVAE